MTRLFIILTAAVVLVIAAKAIPSVAYVTVDVRYQEGPQE